MAKNLVIVESPAKAKTINKYLGKDYKVLASIGHIKDLPPNELGVDTENGFEPKYQIIPDEKKPNNAKIVKELKREAKTSEAVYLAADPDREGEAICQHLKEEIIKNKSTKSSKPVYRVRFNEITEKAIKEAFSNPRQIDENLVNAQKARRVLDRLVGYMVSPFLWKTIGGRLSAGRVQTVALRLIVEREREIQAFVPTEYWTIAADLRAKFSPDFVAKLHKIDDKTIKTGEFNKPIKSSEVHIKTEQDAQKIVDEARSQEFVVSKVTRKERKRNPSPPFITSKLQQEAAKQFGFSASKTMKIAQRLYEGIELGEEGPVGLITYMRTDSTRVSDEALKEVREFISQIYGENYLPSKPNTYKTKITAQDAHEAIRPTSVNRTPESVKNFLTEEELKLYTLIWKRFMASQMSSAVFDQTTIEIKAGRFMFRAIGSVQKFDGFLKVYQETKDEDAPEEEEKPLPEVKEGEKLELKDIIPEQHFTEPPPRYTEASLVKTLEEKGIGRPSTYATIISTIQERDYVEKRDGRFYPTPLGVAVNDLLITSFDEIFNETYTAKLESELDKIEEGKLDWREALQRFYQKFSVDLEKAKEQVKKNKEVSIPTNEKCEKCGSEMVIKFGRFGQFLACSNYPECKNTRELIKTSDSDSAEKADVPPCEVCGKKMVLKKGRYGMFYGCIDYPKCQNTRKVTEARISTPIDETCPKCNSKLVIRWGRYGEFISCADYPKCNYIKKETTGVKCPECKNGEILIRKSKRGRIFYSCSNYPECKTLFWDKPVDMQCPACGAPNLFEKKTKKEGLNLVCEKCGYKETAEVSNS